MATSSMLFLRILCVAGLLAAGAFRLKNEAREISQNPSTFCSTGQDAPNRHVVFYGGTFDPPTVAHLKVASESLKSGIGGINCVWFSPVYHPDYKPNKAHHKIREELISMSFGKDSEKMSLSLAYEESYTHGMDIQRMDYNAYRWLEKKYPQTKFSMVVGADSLTPEGPYTLEGWRDILWRVSRKNGNILVLDRGCDGVQQYENKLLYIWQVSPSPFRDVYTDMSAFSKVSSSGIRDLLLSASDGKIDEELRGKLSEAGLSEPLLDYLATRRELVQRYSGEVSWELDDLGDAFTLENEVRVEPKEPDLEFPAIPEDSSFCSIERDQSNRHVVFYGGTFDPPTVAHMKVASEALKSGIDGINCVWFSPVYHPAYKPNKPPTKTREQMLSLSLEKLDEYAANVSQAWFPSRGREQFASTHEKMKVSKAYELSYYDKMDVQRMDYNAYLWLERNYPKSKFSMVVGADSLTPQGPYTLGGWRDILRSVARSNSHILVLDRDTDWKTTAYQDMLLKQWSVSPSPFVPLSVDMSAYSKVSSSGIKNLMLEARGDGNINSKLFNKMVDAGLAESLVGFLSVVPSLVRKYAKTANWNYDPETLLLEGEVKA